MNKIVEYRNNNMGKGKAIFSKIILVSVFFLAAALISCNAGLSEKPEVKESDSKVSEYVQIGFKLSVPEFEDRKAIPNSSSYSNMVYVLTGISDGGQEETLGTWGSLTQLRNASLTIHTGQWRLTLTSYLNTSSNYDYYDYEYGYSSSSIGYDSAKPILQDTIELILTQSSTLAFTLKEVENCKVNGSFEYTVNYNDSRSENWSLSAKLLNAEDLSQTEYSISYSTSSSYTRFTCSNLPSGNYLLQIQFIYKNGDTSFESYTMPLIQIAAGLKTTGSKTLSAGELTRFYSINYSYLENGVMPENSVSTYTPYKAVVLENPTRTNYKFLGWYYSTDWTDENKLPVNDAGKYILNKNHDLTGNVTIYARWLRVGYEQNGFEWHISDEGVLTISGEGEVPFAAYSFPEWVNATSAVVEEGITGFHYYEYYKVGFGCAIDYYGETEGKTNGYARNIKTISLPSTLTSIPNQCFDCLSSLEEINIPESVVSIGEYAFYGCELLKELRLPDGLTSIGGHAFDKCTGITSMTIPASVTTIYMSAFSGWGAEQAITLDWNSTDTTARSVNADDFENVNTINIHYKDGKDSWPLWTRTHYEQDGFTWDLSVDGVLTIRGEGEVPFYARSFSEWKRASRIVVGEGITGFAYCDGYYDRTGFNSYSGYGANCQNVRTVSLPSTLTSISDSCFENCTSLESIVIPSNVTSIATEAFYGCTSIEEITIPASVTTLYRSAFRDWTDEQAITFDWSSSDSTERSIYDSDWYTTGTSAKYNDGKAAWFSWLLSDDGVLTIRGNGDVPFYSDGISEWKDARSVIVEEGITGFGHPYSIGFSNYYSHNSQNITRIELPSTLRSIPFYCFYNCISLESINIPDNVTSIDEYAFYGCTSLKSITIPQNVTSIGNHVFYGCKSLTSFTIPASVTSIGNYALAYCTGISSITVPATVTEQFNKNVFQGWRSNQSITLDWNSNDSSHAMPYIESTSYYDTNGPIVYLAHYNGTHAKYRNNVYAWNGCALNEDGTTIIVSGQGVHYLYNSEIDLTYVTSIIVEDGITFLDSYNHPENNKSVKSITLPENLNRIGSGVFKDFAGVENIVIPDSVTSIGAYAFENCEALKNINIPNVIESINESTFYGCKSLKSLTLPTAITSIGRYAFKGSGLETINLNGASIAIPEECFVGCTSLSTVTGTSAITSIGKNAFRECSSLSSISLPATLTSIGEYAFYKCTGFTALTIPSSVTEIGSSAFDYCTGSQTITLDWNANDTTERTIASDAFGYAGVVVKYKDGTTYGN